METLIIEIFIDQKWQEVAKVKVQDPKRSSFSRSTYVSNLDFFFEYQEKEDCRGLYTPGLNIPLDPTNHNFNHWPSFLLDLMPQGAARTNVCKREKIIDNQENDFFILQKGAINPVGNIRVKSEYDLFSSTHPGFTKQDIIDLNELFLEHAQQFGAIVVGGSGAQGVAPKFLVNIDHNNHWHCDGAIPDHKVVKSYIVKMPRGKTLDDKLILKSEYGYLKIAKDLGIKSVQDVWWENDLLFVERFDRKCGQNFTRYGLESLSSASGQFQFGIAQKHEESLKIIHQYSQSETDLFEFVARDFLNIVMGNTDNHTRNTAFIKYSEDEVELSPLYDFAPMVMDPELIVRSCKWSDELGNIPNFEKISKELCRYRTKEEVDLFFQHWKKQLEKLPNLWSHYQIPLEVIKRSTRTYQIFMDQLKQYVGTL